jgi:CMP-N-acetylneuraminic acid synthetase
MKQPDVICMIPARGGSKRLKRKNVLPFAGKPLLEWTIIQAKCAHCLTDKDIYLTTDDDEIEEIGRRHNINIIRRPDWPDADIITVGVAYRHALDEIFKKRKPDLCFGLLPTTPCRLPGDIDGVLARYQEMKPLYPDCHEVISIVPIREFLVWKHIPHHQIKYMIFDNTWGYFVQGPATHIYEAEWYYHWIEKRHHWEAVLPMQDRNRIMYYNPCKWFQQFDIDDRDTFDLNELIFERYILSGEDEAIYWRYKENDMARIPKGIAARVSGDVQGEANERCN